MLAGIGGWLKLGHRGEFLKRSSHSGGCPGRPQGLRRPGLSLSGEGGALTAAWRERPWGWTVTRDMLGQLRASLRSPGEGYLSLGVPATEHCWRQTGIHQGSDHTAPFSLGYGLQPLVPGRAGPKSQICPSFGYENQDHCP